MQFQDDKLRIGVNATIVDEDLPSTRGLRNRKDRIRGSFDDCVLIAVTFAFFEDPIQPLVNEDDVQSLIPSRRRILGLAGVGVEMLHLAIPFDN